jgi:hypothetical protein
MRGAGGASGVRKFKSSALTDIAKHISATPMATSGRRRADFRRDLDMAGECSLGEKTVSCGMGLPVLDTAAIYPDLSGWPKTVNVTEKNYST